MHEGGYVNHPKDPGGETNLGVTKRVYQEHGGTKDMKDLLVEDVAPIYKKGYWGITENGIAFCQKEIAMPQFALVYNDFPYEHITNKYVMIDELLAENNLVYDDLIQI